MKITCGMDDLHGQDHTGITVQVFHHDGNQVPTLLYPTRPNPSP